MNSTSEITTAGACMTRSIADLVVDLAHRLEAAYVEADEAKADAKAVREQRGILLERVHELEKLTKRQGERIAALCDENRALRATVTEWQKVAA